jgi:hypothetical protein
MNVSDIHKYIENLPAKKQEDFLFDLREMLREYP